MGKNLFTRINEWESVNEAKAAKTPIEKVPAGEYFKFDGKVYIHYPKNKKNAVLASDFNKQIDIKKGTVVETGFLKVEYSIYIPEEGDWKIKGKHSNCEEAKQAYLKWAGRKTLPKGSHIWTNGV